MSPCYNVFMKKKSFIFIIFFLILIFTFSACNKTKYTVEFDSNGGSKIQAIATDGKSALTLQSPKKSGYTFQGWYYDNNVFRKPFKADSLIKSPIKKNITVYAKWEKQLIATEGLEYDYQENSYVITGYKGDSKNVVIAATYNGYPVTKIQEEAFKDKDTIESVVISSSIIEIQNAAFKGCVSLAEITLPFVGESRETDKSEQAVLGHIFGISQVFSVFPMITTGQNYATDKIAYYYIPSSLKRVIITDAAKIPFGAFSHTAITDVVINDGITSIGAQAFYNCKKLERIFIPDTVDYILDQAFFDCDNLIIYCQEEQKPILWNKNWKQDSVLTYWTIKREDLAYEQGIYFLISDSDTISITSYKSQQENVVIPELIYGMPITAINSVAFNNLSTMKSLLLSDSLISINKGAIKNCKNLTDLTLPFVGNKKNDLTNSHFGYIFGAINASSNKDYVPMSIKNVTISKGDIAPGAFMECKGLQSVTLPEDAKEIGESAFRDCTWLQTIEMFDTLSTIGEYAFSNCESLIGITFSENLTSIGKHAFNKCISLTEIHLPDNIISIQEYTFNACSSLVTVSFPFKLQTIGKRAFSECSSIIQLNFPSKLNRIEDFSFYACQSLLSVNLPDSLSSIAEWSFQGCISLINIYIPSNVTSIGEQAFTDCNNLSICCQAKSQPDGFKLQWNGSRPVQWDCQLN